MKKLLILCCIMWCNFSNADSLKGIPESVIAEYTETCNVDQWKHNIRLMYYYKLQSLEIINITIGEITVISIDLDQNKARCATIVTIDFADGSKLSDPLGFYVKQFNSEEEANEYIKQQEEKEALKNGISI